MGGAAAFEGGSAAPAAALASNATHPLDGGGGAPNSELEPKQLAAAPVGRRGETGAEEVRDEGTEEVAREAGADGCSSFERRTSTSPLLALIARSIGERASDPSAIIADRLRRSAALDGCADVGG